MHPPVDPYCGTVQPRIFEVRPGFPGACRASGGLGGPAARPPMSLRYADHAGAEQLVDPIGGVVDLAEHFARVLADAVGRTVLGMHRRAVEMVGARGDP